jgi:hypothetical protein
MSQRQTELLEFKQNPKERHVRSRSCMHVTFNYLISDKYQSCNFFKVHTIAKPQILGLIPQIRNFLVYPANLQISPLFPSASRKFADFSAKDSEYETPQKFFHFIANQLKVGGFSISGTYLRTSHLCKIYTIFTYFISFKKKSTLHPCPGLYHPTC